LISVKVKKSLKQKKLAKKSKIIETTYGVNRSLTIHSDQYDGLNKMHESMNALRNSLSSNLNESKTE
jgi:hypothetical protein